ncbi:MAG: dephospho-CoA kinase [Betaproteobacteria bacterium]
MPFTVGLTGGIGSGKTTVAELFASRGACVVDADEISRKLTGAGQPAVAQIVGSFGAQFAAQDGSLDRQRMRDLVFSDASARKNLESILHPLIRQESALQLRACKGPYAILVVPLLIESGNYRTRTNRVAVVDCDAEIQVRRVMERGGLSRGEVLAIIASQIPRQDRLAAADDVIRNDGDLPDLELQIVSLHARYIELAAAHKS